MPAGQFGDIVIKPGLDAEEGGHFCNPPADGGRIIPKAFQAKGQLVPHLVGDDLVFRALLDKPDRLALAARIHPVQRRAFKPDFAGALSVRREHGFHLPQERRFAAPGRPAQHQKLPGLHGQGHALQRVPALLRIGKG